MTFALESEIPNSFLCKEFTVLNEYRDLEYEQYDSNLVYDGTNLRYDEYDDNYLIHSFDPTTGSFVPPAVTVTHHNIHACDTTGPYFWEAYYNEVNRLNSTFTEVGDFHTNADLGHEIRVYTIAWDGTNLWLNGKNDDTSKYELLKVGVSWPVITFNDPDDVYEFDYLDALTWDGASLWSLSGRSNASIAKIDPVSLKAVETYRGPDPDIHWEGIAAVGSDLYLLGTDRDKSDNKGVIFQVTPN